MNKLTYNVHGLGLILLCWFPFCAALGQYGSDSLVVNNINALVRSDGALFWDPGTYAPGFEVPVGSGQHSMFAANLWVGGRDAAGSLHLAAQMYYQAGTDYWPGPVANTYPGSYDTRYNRLWKLSRQQIETHLTQWQLPGYVPPAVILDWPAHGDTTRGEAYDLAPFIDQDADGHYEPLGGDYPAIRGDQAVVFILNDQRAAHSASAGEPLGLDIIGMLYGFQDESSAALQHTVFLHYTLINRSAHTYDSLRAGFWHDTELGQGGDDLAGCDTALYLGYVYNAGETDNVYGASPPAQGTVWLGEDDWRYITHQNNFSLTGVPQFATEYYTYLDARWKDGSPVTRGGSGYGGITPVQYIYSGDPVADTGWTARQAFPSGTDVLSVLAGGPYTLAPGDRVCLDMALAFARDSAGGADRLGNISLLRQYAATLRAFYQAQGYACDDQATGISSPGPALQQKIFPNPAREILCITTSLPLVSVTIWNSLGQPIPVAAHQEPGRICLDLNGLTPGHYWIRYTGQDTEGSAGFVVWP